MPSSERSIGLEFSQSSWKTCFRRLTRGLSSISIASSRRESKLPGAMFIEPTMARLPSARSIFAWRWSPLSLWILIPTSCITRSPATPSRIFFSLSACGGSDMRWTLTPREWAATSRSTIVGS